ncbi:MAG: hypothetical protein LC637_13450 [Xanthomonadaceae bacterium]|nr:hypothetical protein [Xanthomonadaceae bacterium]
MTGNFKDMSARAHGFRVFGRIAGRMMFTPEIHGVYPPFDQALDHGGLVTDPEWVEQGAHTGVQALEQRRCKRLDSIVQQQVVASTGSHDAIGLLTFGDGL